jgi:PKD repeat protein
MGYRLRATLAGLALVLSACGVHQAVTPTATGPSGFATTVTMTANPDSISQDGASQSAIVVTANNASGAALSGLTVRLSTMVAGTVQDFGVLSARSVVTDSAGHANAVYTAPPSSPLTGGSGVVVSIIASPIGTDAVTTNSRQVDIRLVPPGVILPPAGTPTASFTVSPTPVLANVPSIFDASSSTPGSGSAGIVSYSWNFGDGAQASGRSVSHTFNAQASFLVTLTVVNDRGVAASTTQSVGAGALGAPKPAFVFSPTAPAAGQTVQFNADQSTAAPGHTITTYNWNFGDGSTASGLLTSHVYTVANSYNVVLSVLDDTGQKGTISQSISVAAGGGGGSGGPTARFTFSPATPTALQAVFFNGSTSTAATGHTITTYAWDFGDGTTALGVSVAHTFTAAGTFTVTLTVTDDILQKGTIGATVPVTIAGSGSLTAAFNNSPTDPRSGQLVSFNANQSSPQASITAYDWDFGDGTVVNGQTSFLINHTYFTATGNTFVIRLTVHDNTGRVATVANSLPVTSGTGPTASFTVTPSPAPVNTSVAFNGSSSTPGAQPIANYQWDFGDGSAVVSTGLVNNTSHTYTVTGTYVIRLTVTDSSGQFSATTRTLQVQ